MRDSIRALPPLRLTPREFRALPDYSGSLPTGTTPGKRWRRLDGAHDRDCKDPCWMIGEYDPSAPTEKDIATAKAAGLPYPKNILIFWYRPIIVIRAEAKEVADG